MKKFERKEGINISNLSIDTPSHEKIETMVSKLKDMKDTLRNIYTQNGEQSNECVSLDEIQMASTEGLEYININNAHLLHPNKSDESVCKKR